MKNLIQDLPESINITVTKKDLIEFADYILSHVASNIVETQATKKSLTQMKLPN